MKECGEQDGHTGALRGLAVKIEEGLSELDPGQRQSVAGGCCLTATVRASETDPLCLLWAIMMSMSFWRGVRDGISTIHRKLIATRADRAPVSHRLLQTEDHDVNFQIGFSAVDLVI